ncbi:hypothetical protein OG948_59715 (plasmid) [Embleya sp. NBC_00888]|uniref:hypothetical protein n=1 Tax=Embleya sp. NBC_00888 TaxID=2975960 RepID=UPI00386FBA67|nr:hypothetical protein OG948_59715 [Embleya sp. NBC_00888]
MHEQDPVLREFLDEATNAWALDANLARLREIDPDAELITIAFVDALCNPELYGEQGRSHQEYVTAKQAQGRLDLWELLFAGVCDTDHESAS